jgi:F0F1-type ATP synthase assembly protein I
MNANKPDPKQPMPMSRALGIASTIGVQAGCAGVILIIGAVLLGRWLDGQFGSAPWITLTFILLSMPLSLLVIFRMVMQSVRRLEAANRAEEEKADHGEPW